MATANSSINTDLNVDPYYDDFDETKNFHRILFRPGFAVQARELTQLQSILQNQIDRFGEHVFKEGSVVRGCEIEHIKFVPYVQLRDNDPDGVTVDVDNFFYKTVSANNGVTANVIFTADGSESESDKKTLYLSYTSKSTDDFVTGTFSNGQNIVTSGNTFSANVLTSTTSTGFGSLIRLGEGIVFAKDHFIRVPEQTIIIDRYTTTANARIGYTIDESIVSFTTDETLLDPAQGAFNFTAPGADRLKLTASIVNVSRDAETQEDFIEIARFRNGNIEFKSDKPVYSQIDDYIARRTFETSGHFISNGLQLKLREHLKQNNNGGVFTLARGGDSDLLSVDVKPGRAYVFGYERDVQLTQHLEVDKGLDFIDVNAGTATTNYGNYVTVKNVAGTWDYNNHDKVSLRDTAQSAVANNLVANTVVGAELGTARVRAVDYVSGVPGSADARYNLYLYDINMANGPFTDVRSVYYDDTDADGKADIVLTANAAVLQETSFNFGVYELPSSFIRRLRDVNGNIDTSHLFLKQFDVTIDSSGTFTLNTGNVNERYQDTGLQSASQKRDNFYIVLREDATSASPVSTGSTTGGSNTVSGVSGASSIFNAGDRIKIGSFANTFTISEVGSTTLNLHQNVNFNSSANGISKVYTAGSVLDMAGVGAGGARTINVTSATGATFDTQETFSAGADASVLVKLNRVNAREKSKILRSDRFVQIDSNTAVSNTVGPWSLGLTDVLSLKEVRKSNSQFTSLTQGDDVTSNFALDNGQRDNIYNLAQLKKRPDSTLTISNGDYLLVKLDHFSEDTSQGTGYFSVDSYPIDDDNAANTSAILTSQIPTYTSPVSGEQFRLRDSIDIRPRVTNTANSVTSLVNITTNPANTHTTILEGTGDGLRYSPPNENFVFDYSFYLPRIDRIIIDKEGDLRVVKGTSSFSPRNPPVPADGFNLGTVFVSPYPSVIAPVDFVPGSNNESQFSLLSPDRITNVTYEDIQVVKQRVNNLEYTTRLNLLELSASSLNITDDNGLSRFKSGFLVESFLDQSIANINDVDHKLLIDIKNREGTPRVYDEFTKLEYNSATSSNVVRSSGDVRLTVTTTDTFTVGETISIGGNSGTLRYQVNGRLYLENVSGTFPSSGTVTGSTSGSTGTITEVFVFPDGKLITLPFTHDLIIENDKFSSFRNCTGLVYSFEGIVTLDPDTDIWVDVTQLPDVFRTDDIVRTTVGTTRNRRNAGETSTVLSETTTTETETLSTQTIPFIRGQDINFEGQGLIPNARHFAFFDGEPVNDFCQPANSSFANTGGLGAPLITDNDGLLRGIFKLPNTEDTRFETGENLTFRLIDNPNNDTSNPVTFTSFGEGNFFASGSLETVQDTIITTRQVERRVVRFVRPRDPVAQTFRVADSLNESDDFRRNPSASPGMFLTKLDLYFATKDLNLGVEVEIREVDPSSGFITQNVVPFSRKVLQPDDINDNSSTPSPTPVYFDTPIYLLTDVDYAFVVRPVGGNPGYNIWTATLGETDVVTGNRISVDPYAGLLFVSSNDRNWTAVQEENISFKMYFADFNTSQSGFASVRNEDSEYFTISSVDPDLTYNASVDGETTLVLDNTITANVGDIVQGNTSIATGTITNVSGNNVTLKDVSLTPKFSDGEFITLLFANNSPIGGGTPTSIVSQSTPSGVIGYINASEAENGRMTLVDVSGTFSAGMQIKEQTDGYTATIDSVTNLNVDEAFIYMSRLGLQGTGVTINGKLATSTTTRDSTFAKQFADDGRTFFDDRKFILGRAQEVAGLSGEKSADIRINLSNESNSRHSPAVDVDRLGISTTEFFVNDDVTGETNAEGGNAIAKYISNVVELAEGLDAEDLRVLVTAYQPSVTNVRVYAKFLNSADDATIGDRPWQQLNKTTPSTVVSRDTDRDDFVELEYNLPVSLLTGTGDEYQYTADGVTYTGYKYFAIKIVLTTSNEAKIPRIKNYKALALQK